jgi:hypothetical protein
VAAGGQVHWRGGQRFAHTNGWIIAQQAGDRAPRRTQRLLGRAVWDVFAAMEVVLAFAAARRDEAARGAGRRCGLRVGGDR